MADAASSRGRAGRARARPCWGRVGAVLGPTARDRSVARLFDKRVWHGLSTCVSRVALLFDTRVRTSCFCVLSDMCVPHCFGSMTSRGNFSHTSETSSGTSWRHGRSIFRQNDKPSTFRQKDEKASFHTQARHQVGHVVIRSKFGQCQPPRSQDAFWCHARPCAAMVLRRRRRASAG